MPLLRRRDAFIEVTTPIILDSGDVYDGEGMLHRLAPGCVLKPYEAMIMTRNFAQAINRNMWKYDGGKTTNLNYKPYTPELYAWQPLNCLFKEEQGMHIQCTVKNVVLDGNARSGAKGGGIHLYGKGHRIFNCEIADITKDPAAACQGLWTECGDPTALFNDPNNKNANAWQGDTEWNWKQQVESMVSHVRLSNANVWHRGPNDSSMQHIYVKDGSFQIGFSKGLYSGAGCKLAFIHCYPNCNIKIEPWGCYGNNLYVDTPTKGKVGLEIAGDTVLNGVLVTGHDGPLPAIRIQDHNNQITNILYRQPRTNGLQAIEVLGDRNFVSGKVFNGAKVFVKLATSKSAIDQY